MSEIHSIISTLPLGRDDLKKWNQAVSQHWTQLKKTSDEYELKMDMMGKDGKGCLHNRFLPLNKTKKTNKKETSNNFPI